MAGVVSLCLVGTLIIRDFISVTARRALPAAVYALEAATEETE